MRNENIKRWGRKAFYITLYFIIDEMTHTQTHLLIIHLEFSVLNLIVY